MLGTLNVANGRQTVIHLGLTGIAEDTCNSMFNLVHKNSGFEQIL
jgi:hypothetical protein